MIKNTTPTEYEEQTAFVQYLELKNIKFTSIPNSTWTSSFRQKAINKATGLNPGLPDLVLVFPKQNILLWIEMKRIKKSVLSEFQKSWIEELNKIDNVRAEVCYGAEQAIDCVEKILKLKN